MREPGKHSLTISVIVGLILQIVGMQSAFAWNDFGHMAVACIAYKKLNPNTKARVDELLKLNPFYQKWIRELEEKGQKGDRNTLIFMLAATWPDLIKKDKTYISDGSLDGNRPEGPEAARNIGYSDKLMHKYWHFYDKSFTRDGSKAIKIPAPNAITQIAAFRKVLSSKKASDSLKSYDLNWLLHLVGDMHQPLHCATRVSKHEPDGDNGGNNIYVKYGDNPKPQRMHWFWDSCLGSGLPDDALRFAETIPSVNSPESGNTNTKSWLKESFAYTQSHVYIPPIESANGPYELTNAYQEQAKTLCRKRVALAGMRLAKILNNELR